MIVEGRNSDLATISQLQVGQDPGFHLLPFIDCENVWMCRVKDDADDDDGDYKILVDRY
jgi:hypothetical protein